MFRTCLVTFFCVFCSFPLPAAERVVLSEGNWDDYVPAGKEVDAIYGDLVLRNDKIHVVIAKPGANRNANMTVRNVGGAVIDLTQRSPSNDQLSCYYPGSSAFRFMEMDGDSGKELSATKRAAHVEYECKAAATDGKPEVILRYDLTDGDAFLSVKTIYRNPHDKPIEFQPLHNIRADRSFKFGLDKETGLFWAYDNWWRQAVGMIVDGSSIDFVGDSLSKNRPIIKFMREGSSKVTLAASQTFELNSKLIPAQHQLELFTIGRKIVSGTESHKVALTVADLAGPIDNAKVDIYTDGGLYGSGTTTSNGTINFGLPSGNYQVEVISVGRPAKKQDLNVRGSVTSAIRMEMPGYVMAKVTDHKGHPIPCKIEFQGKNGTKNPYFGPDSKVFEIRNLRYTPNGVFRQRIAPGEYNVIISHGNEYDAVFTSVKVEQGKDAWISAKLRRSVDTTGWISSDFHSHSTPSGDNTSSQRGRVLNLLAEHIEFGPCTEHNRISSYEQHIRFFNAAHLMATCSGMELTGQPLPVNHQNVFPLIHRPRTQDGGGPQTDPNPVVQIERLALWDNNSEKLLQENHPNIAQIIGDRDTDGSPDGGFEKMFGYMDVIEVHPPAKILQGPELDERGRGNRMFQWMQLLNLGYRIPGVVNTDAHYNFHGSGWLRNYIQSSTDEPAKISIQEMVQSAEKGHVIMTNGPFLEATASSGDKTASVGDDLQATNGKIELAIRVQCANWLDINCVQIIVNGKLERDLNFTRVTHPAKFKTGVVKFDQTIQLKLKADAHVIVVAAGKGLTLGSVVGPDHTHEMPIAVANPFFIDVDGNGFQPNHDQLGDPLPIVPARFGNVLRWQKAISGFKQQDKKSPPPKNGILFLGSSSIRMWNLDKHFPDVPAINRGFGGSQVSDSLYFADQIVLPYQPRTIVFYAGDNDIAAGETPETVFEDYCDFVEKVHSNLPKCKIVFLAIKPSLARWDKVATMRQANKLVQEKSSMDELLEYVDIDTPMLGEDGKPMKDLFLKDGLHLNEKGYEMWTKLVREKL